MRTENLLLSFVAVFVDVLADGLEFLELFFGDSEGFGMGGWRGRLCHAGLGLYCGFFAERAFSGLFALSADAGWGVVGGGRHLRRWGLRVSLCLLVVRCFRYDGRAGYEMS